MNITALTVTSAALKQIRKFVQQKPNIIGLRIGVKQRGCSGLSYTLEYATEKQPHDIEVQTEDVKIFLDRKAQLSLIGSEMDFKSDKLSSEFVFKNPNAAGTCGCGKSFTLKSQAVKQ